MTKQEFITLQKECDSRFMDFIGNDWTFVTSLTIGQKISIPANCIAPDTIGEWIDASEEGSYTNEPIKIHIGYGEIISVRDGHNRLKGFLSNNPSQLVECIFVGKR